MRPCHILRVFTRGDEGGNHLGVVPDGVGLSDEAMQAVATDLGYPETVFISWAEGEPPSVRIFTPAVELPFAGHPLVGAAWVLSMLGPGGTDRLRCGIGDVGLEVDGDLAWIETKLNQRVESLNDPLETAREHELPPAKAARLVMMPLPYLLLELEDPQNVTEADPKPSSFDVDDLVYIWAWKSESEVKARFFAPGVGVFEDPATGSAAVALAAALQARGRSRGRLVIHQGDEVGSPSTIRLSWGGARARIGGTVRRDEVLSLPA
jgi:trans-2,3-dihydro-3-hydroxyanthranilate isomerase